MNLKDALSYFQFQRFRLQAPLTEPSSTPIPSGLLTALQVTWLLHTESCPFHSSRLPVYPSLLSVIAMAIWTQMGLLYLLMLIRFATSLSTNLNYLSTKLYLSSTHLTSELKGPHDAVGSLLLCFFCFLTSSWPIHPLTPVSIGQLAMCRLICWWILPSFRYTSCTQWWAPFKWVVRSMWAKVKAAFAQWWPSITLWLCMALSKGPFFYANSHPLTPQQLPSTVQSNCRLFWLVSWSKFSQLQRLLFEEPMITLSRL